MSLGLLAENAITNMPGFAGTDVDEMNFKFFAGIPAWIKTLSWDTSQIAGASLWSLNANPLQMAVIRGVTLGATTYYVADTPPVSFLANYFEYWRGSFIVKIKVVKTSFHSGRLLVTFNNSGGVTSSSTFSATVGNSGYINRDVLDIREGSEFTFKLPYTGLKPWLKTGDFATGATCENYGVFQIFVLNSLTAPSTVSSQVQLLIEVCADSNFEVACPRVTDAYTTLELFEPQGSDEMDNECQLVNKTIGESISGIDSLIFSEMCIGEHISSFRMLLKRMCGSSTIDTLAVGLRVFGIGTNSLTPGTKTNFFEGDYISQIAMCYAYNRGSVRIKLYPQDQNSLLPMTAQLVLDDTVNSVVTASSGDSFVQRGSIVPHNYKGDLSLETHVPAYNQLFCRLNMPVTAHADEPVNIYSSRVRALFTFNSAPTGTVRVTRGAGDDYSLGYFLSTPALIIATSS